MTVSEYLHDEYLYAFDESQTRPQRKYLFEVAGGDPSYTRTQDSWLEKNKFLNSSTDKKPPHIFMCEGEVHFKTMHSCGH